MALNPHLEPAAGEGTEGYISPDDVQAAIEEISTQKRWRRSPRSTRRLDDHAQRLMDAEMKADALEPRTAALESPARPAGIADEHR